MARFFLKLKFLLEFEKRILNPLLFSCSLEKKVGPYPVVRAAQLQALPVDALRDGMRRREGEGERVRKRGRGRRVVLSLSLSRRSAVVFFFFSFFLFFFIAEQQFFSPSNISPHLGIHASSEVIRCRIVIVIVVRELKARGKTECCRVWKR